MGDNGCTGAFFDPCRYLGSQYQSRHGLVRAWADTLRQRATLDDVLKAQHAGGFAHQPSMTALWLRTLCLRRWAGLSAQRPGLNVLIYDPMVTISSAWIWRA